MNIGSLPDGSRGFDANARIGPKAAAAFRAAGYLFAVRYVRRAAAHDYDLSAAEAGTIIGAGLGLMVVQHVAAPGWRASRDLGEKYGAIAAHETSLVGVPPMVHVWCDLEGVATDCPPDDVIAFCDAWYDAVDAAGFAPGLYVGDCCILSPDELYGLKFSAYWSAYNLNRDALPAVRGVCLKQSVAHPADWVAGFDSQTMDVDTIHTDALGGSPTLWLPLENLAP